MKDYKDYMDNLSVDETLHEKIMYRLTQSSTRQHIGTNNLRKYISVAACAAIMLFFIIGVYPHMNIWNTTPNGSNSNIPNAAGDTNPGDRNPLEDKLDTIEKSSAVYHDIDASQLIRQVNSSKVPFGFVFNNKLIDLVRINSGITNNGVRWEEHKYTREDVESALQTSVKDPDLPDGDYTINQYVLVDEATESIIAYQTVYYYFNKDTLELQDKFSIFYFEEKYFKSEELEQMKNVSITNKETSISDFPEPTNVHVKVPHVRKLVYVENGISVVIEAEADFVQENSVVNKEKSLERYKQTDKQLVDIMKSLI
jgi:hypothetical protein